MLDRNIVMLAGSVGDKIKWGKTKTGKEYCSFCLVVNSFSAELGDENEESRSKAYIRLFVFNSKKSKLVDYLKKVGLHQGQRLDVFGAITSYHTEYKGVSLVQNNIQVRDITVIKTKADKEAAKEIQKEIDNNEEKEEN